ncbi:hypothetical protein APY94_06140 [Thermococcus celericrescens]|uniref:Uncharacterized protein n=1 Tax=Thermococcus celericrescens TaxID=227598 RepID=A0A100XXW9_9EURY|nr:hypothetical protein APY94_06140 [Thermococcus celericrescens]
MENLHPIQETLNFDEEFASSRKDNVYPLLARYDRILIFERQKQCYDEKKLHTINRGHVTGAIAYNELRRHILKVLSTMKTIR